MTIVKQKGPLGSQPKGPFSAIINYQSSICYRPSSVVPDQVPALAVFAADERRGLGTVGNGALLAVELDRLAGADGDVTEQEGGRQQAGVVEVGDGQSPACRP